MHTALALSALLLVLRSPLASLSQNDASQPSIGTTASTQTPTKPVTESPASSSQSSPSSVSTTPIETSTTELSSSLKTDQVLGSSSAGFTGSPQQSTSVTLSPDPSNTAATTTVDSQGGSPGHPATTTSTTPENTSNSGTPATTHPVSTSQNQLETSPSQDLPLKTTAPTHAPSLPSTGSSNPLASVTAVPSGSSPQGQKSSTTPSSSSGLLPDSGLTPTAQRTLTTQTPVDLSPGTQQASSMRPASQVPASPMSGSQMPPSPSPSSSVTPQPTDSPTGTVTVPGIRGPTSLSTVSASQSPSIPTKLWNFGNKTVLCESLKESIDKLLVLNLTSKGTNPGTNHCNKNLLNENLVTVLCRAVKANFNPGQDNCNVQLAPVPNSHAVAIKHISIQTNLLPTDVYKSLKDQWDELEELGVSDMKLGDDGPPEMTEDRYSMPLIITIVCMASFLLLVAALYGCCHQRFSQRKDQNSHLDSSTQIPGSQPWLRTSRSCKNIPMPSFLTRQREPDLWISQRLTEELQTVENGYHDNPTLEVMETSSEMQEKKVVNLNGELGDSWIVPLDNLTKDDLDEEEDTHL
ncbi:podocalyxin isoform X2 [Heterocephalus glaber]|uniref:Podocalyxin n=1 Tax=Heterocephalus glaber TaxID=10181 RepID=A0AAX6R7I5_HETGA|nr:podocalyxin isoform X2 [Heterocephalus glaber]